MEGRKRPRRPPIKRSTIASVVILDIIGLNRNLKGITFHFSFGFRFLTIERDACFSCHYCRIIKQRSMASLWHDFQELPIVFLLVKNEIKLSLVVERVMSDHDMLHAAIYYLYS